MDLLFALFCLGLGFGGGLGGGVLATRIILNRRALPVRRVEEASKGEHRDSGNVSKPVEKRLKALESTLNKIHPELQNRTAETKVDKLKAELNALEKNNVRPLAQQCERVERELRKVQDWIRDQTIERHTTETLVSESAEVRLEVPIVPVQSAPVEMVGETPPAPLPSGAGHVLPITPAPQTVSSLSETAPAALPSGASHVLPVTPAPQTVSSLGETIVQSFDAVDALTMRKVERMREEWKQRLGSVLTSLEERDGAYVFLLNDETAYVHPKPNSPLPRFWERAFPGADSYSRPVRKVFEVARVRFLPGDYEVIEKGAFLVP